MDFGNQGARTERPYPPCSMKANSCLSSSRMSRSSLTMASILLFSLSFFEQQAAALCSSLGFPTRGKATDMPTRNPKPLLKLQECDVRHFGETFAGCVRKRPWASDFCCDLMQSTLTDSRHVACSFRPRL